ARVYSLPCSRLNEIHDPTVGDLELEGLPAECHDRDGGPWRNMIALLDQPSLDASRDVRGQTKTPNVEPNLASVGPHHVSRGPSITVCHFDHQHPTPRPYH